MNPDVLCAPCQGFAARLAWAKSDLGRAARRCARNDTPRNREGVSEAKRVLDGLKAEPTATRCHH